MNPQNLDNESQITDLIIKKDNTQDLLTEGNGIIESVKGYSKSLGDSFIERFNRLKDAFGNSIDEVTESTRGSLNAMISEMNNVNYDFDNEKDLQELVSLKATNFGEIIENLNESDRNKIINYLKNNDEQRSKFLEIQNKEYNKGHCPGNLNHYSILEEIRKLSFSEEINYLKNNIITKLRERLNGEEELANMLFEKIYDSINESPCTFDLIEIFNDFNNNEIKLYNDGSEKTGKEKIIPIKPSEIKEGIRSLVELKKTEINASVTVLELQIGKINQDTNLSVTERQNALNLISQQREKQTALMNGINRVEIVGRNLNDSEIQQIIVEKSEGKTNEEIMAELRLKNPELDKELKEYEKKLENIKNGISDNVDFSQNGIDNDINFYLENIEQIYLIDNEEFLIKILKKYNEISSDKSIRLKNINTKFRGNINVLNELKSENFDYLELSLINEDFFRNFDNLVFILNKIYDYKAVFLIINQIYNKDELLKKISELINHQKLSDKKTGLINAIPINILKLDTTNIILLPESDLNGKEDKLKQFVENNEIGGIETIKENITYLINPNNSEALKQKIFIDEVNQDTLENVYLSKINLYIELNGIGGLESEINLLIENGGFKKLPILPVFLNKNNIDLSISVIKYDANNITNIPLNLRGNEKIINTLINAKNFDIESHLEYIEFNNIISLISFYKLLKEKKLDAIQIVLNKKIRFKIKYILEKSKISDLSNDGNINQEGLSILGELNEIILDISNKGKKIKEMAKKLEENKNYIEEYKNILKEFGINEENIEKIINFLKRKGTLTIEIYNIISEALNKDDGKINNLITKLELVNLDRANSELALVVQLSGNIDSENTFKQKYTIINNEGILILDNTKIESDFLKFFQKNPKNDNEHVEEYEQRLINKFLEKSNLKPEEHKIFEEYIIKILEREKIKYNVKHINKYIEYLSGEKTKEEFEKESYKNLNNIDELEEENLINLGSYNFTESDYIKTDSGYIIKSPTDGKEIIISQEEKEITQNNPKALENLINFYDFFEDLNLTSVWKYRKEIVDSMVNINIDLNDDSLNNAELIRFGNNLIRFINNVPDKNGKSPEKSLLLKSNNLGGIQNELKKYSGANSILSNEKSYGIYGNDRFSYDLRRLGIIGNSLGFQKNKFRDIMEAKV